MPKVVRFNRILPDSASFVLVSVAPLEDPCTEGMETYIEINLNSIKGAVEQNYKFSNVGEELVEILPAVCRLSL